MNQNSVRYHIKVQSMIKSTLMSPNVIIPGLYASLVPQASILHLVVLITCICKPWLIIVFLEHVSTIYIFALYNLSIYTFLIKKLDKCVEQAKWENVNLGHFQAIFQVIVRFNETYKILTFQGSSSINSWVSFNFRHY